MTDPIARHRQQVAELNRARRLNGQFGHRTRSEAPPVDVDACAEEPSMAFAALRDPNRVPFDGEVPADRAEMRSMMGLVGYVIPDEDAALCSGCGAETITNPDGTQIHLDRDGIPTPRC